MKPRDEHLQSFIDDIRELSLLRVLTWRGKDVAAAWYGAHEPATNSRDAELGDLARMNRDHYLFYRALVEMHDGPNRTALDVGCGSGQRTAMLHRYFDRVTGVDSDMSKIAFAAIINNHGNIDWVFGDFGEMDYNDRTFDAVFAVEMIEHVPLEQQIAFINKLVSRVAPGGALFMTTPRDKNPERKPPHIGLWDDEVAECMVNRFNANLSYFNVGALRNGGIDPHCTKDNATHYVMVVKR